MGYVNPQTNRPRLTRAQGRIVAMREALEGGWSGSSAWFPDFGVSNPCHLAVTADSYFGSAETTSENLSRNSALGRT